VWRWSNCCWLAGRIRSRPGPSRGPHRSRGPDGVNLRRLHRSSGNTELTDSGSQSLTISGHQLARPPRAHPRSRSGRALPPTSSREPRVGLSGSSNRVPARTRRKRLVYWFRRRDLRGPATIWIWNFPGPWRNSRRRAERSVRNPSLQTAQPQDPRNDRTNARSGRDLTEVVDSPSSASALCADVDSRHILATWRLQSVSLRRSGAMTALHPCRPPQMHCRRAGWPASAANH
jgi:hypothetical protein